MKFLIIGNNLKDNSLEMSYKRAIETNGFSVDTYEIFSNFSSIISRFLKLSLRFKFFQSNLNYIFYYNDLFNIISNTKYETIIIFKCWYLNSKVLKKIKKISGAKIINYCSDHPYSNIYLRSSINSEKVKQYDLICSFSEKLKPIWYQLGAKKYLTIPFGCDRKFRKQISENVELKWVYFGAWGPYIEEILLNISDFKILIFGSGWKKAKKSFQRKFIINPKEYSSNSMYSLANISFCVLNFTRLEHSCLHTMKTFEIPNSGSFYISNFSDEQNSYFRNKHSAIYFDSFFDLPIIMKKLEKDKNYSNRLKKNAFNESKNHFYDERIKLLLANL